MKKQIVISNSIRASSIVGPLAETVRSLQALALAASLLVPAISPLRAAPMNPAFTYQGRLYDNGSAVSGSYDFQFWLMPGLNANAAVCPDPVKLNDVLVTNGVFTVALSFCPGAFDGSDRWLQIAVSPHGQNSYSTLQPLQPITATPYALHADNAQTAATAQQADQATHAATADTATSVPWASITGAPTTLGTPYAAGPGLLLSGGTFSLDTAFEDARYNGQFWRLGGNTAAASGVLGTLNNLPLDLTANSQRMLRLQPTTTSPNLIGGHSGNAITGGVVGGTVSGGGFYSTGGFGLVFDDRNRVTDDYGSVGGGSQNRAGNDSGTTSDAPYATVSGGRVNTAAGTASSVSGGNNNYAGGAYASIPGGSGNRANGDYSFAAGSGAKAMHQGSFVWADSTPTEYLSTANDQFSVRAHGGIRLEGRVSLSYFDLLFQNPDSLNHGIGYRQYLGGSTFVNGPFIYGFSGGALGTKDSLSSNPELAALTWNNAGDVSITRDSTTSRDLYVSRNATIAQNLSTATLTIRGGSDLAEPFQMSEERLPEGAVVVIDAENPGRLKLSDHAYDSRVAGVISGANGIHPGIAMHQEGALEGGQNVALTGRVYVQADANYGPINPGDLLTTSDTPGCAMKVSNHLQAQGAVIGKAMGSLKRGKGLVLVLVSLQ